MASPAPPAFTVILWIGAFAALVWGISALTGLRRGSRRADGAPPVREDETIDQPRP